MQKAQMEHVTALMKKLIAHGNDRDKVVADDDVKTAIEASLHLIPRLLHIQENLGKGTDALERTNASLEVLEAAVRFFLESIVDVQDSEAGQAFLKLHGCSHMTASDRENPGRSARFELELLYQKMQGEILNADVLLADIVDDETYKLYEEIDRIALAEEAVQSRTCKGRLQIAKIFVSHLMHIDQIENTYQILAGCFDKDVANQGTSPGKSIVSRSRVTPETVVTGLEFLGWRVSEQQIVEMLEETDAYVNSSSRNPTLTEFLTQSATFRALLFSMNGSCFGSEQAKWTSISHCRVLATFPVWWQMEALPTIRLRTYKKGAKLVLMDIPVDELYIIKKGEVVLENSTGELVTTLHDHDVVGCLEFFCGTGALYTVKASSETIVYVVAMETVAKAIENCNGQYVAGAAEELIKYVNTTKESAPVMTQGYTMSRDMSPDEYMTMWKTSILERFTSHLTSDLPSTKPIDFAREVFPGLDAIGGSWEALAEKRATISIMDVLALHGYLGEVGELFFDKFRMALFNCMKTRISTENMNIEDEEATIARQEMELTGLFGLYDGRDADGNLWDLDLLSVNFEINEQMWWESWLWTLNHSSEASQVSIETDLVPIEAIEKAFQEDEELEISMLEEAWSYLTFSRITKDLLSKHAIERYEPAYLMVMGNLTERMPLRKVPEFLRLIFPKHTSKMSNVHVGQFLGIFGMYMHICTYYTQTYFPYNFGLCLDMLQM